LLASATVGDVAVLWSPPLQREIAKVVYREGVLRLLRETKASSPGGAVPEVRLAFNSLGEQIEAQLAQVERAFRLVPDVSGIEQSLVEAIKDPADRMALRTALIGGARHILSLDERHLPHDVVFHGVRCWHPDTFLTIFYQQNPDANRRASAGVRMLPAAVRRLLP
jgi:hypothetical protein